MEHSAITGTDDGLVFEDGYLGLKVLTHVARGGRVAEDEPWRDILEVQRRRKDKGGETKKRKEEKRERTKKRR